jgi:acetyl esterase
MAKPLSREQYHKKGMQIYRMGKLIFTIQKWFARPKPRGLRREVFIDTAFGRVRTLWYGFDNPDQAPLLIDMHGGGVMMGSPEMDKSLNLELCRLTGCKVVSISYAKAPEFPYPAAVEQVYAVAEHLWQNAQQYGIDPQHMAIGGHSAGANLATVACMKAKADGRFNFTCQLLDYPPVDLVTDPYDKPKPKGCIPPEMASTFNACYVDPSQAREPYASPLFANLEDLKGLPPALVILAGQDSLHDEGQAYAEKLRTACVEVELRDYPNARHNFTVESSEDALHALGVTAGFLNTHFRR